MPKDFYSSLEQISQNPDAGLFPNSKKSGCALYAAAGLALVFTLAAAVTSGAIGGLRLHQHWQRDQKVNQAIRHYEAKNHITLGPDDRKTVYNEAMKDKPHCRSIEDWDVEHMCYDVVKEAHDIKLFP